MPHTPGPWTMKNTGDGKSIFVTGSANDYFVNLDCEIDSDDKDGETAEANARLIVAAPELLDALKMVQEIVTSPEPNCSCHISPPCNDCVEWAAIRETLATVKSAIAKATI